MIESTAMIRPQASPKVQIDDNRVKVTEWRFPPGGETGWHHHATDNTNNQTGLSSGGGPETITVV